MAVNGEIMDTLWYIVDNMATKQDLQGLETRLNVKIEHEVTGKIEALFDGYKTHPRKAVGDGAPLETPGAAPAGA